MIDHHNLQLGKKTEYISKYNRNLLTPIKRDYGRKEIKTFKNNVSVFGEDIWNLYELSWLNKNGVPQVAIGEVKIDSNSINLIESKSFKLYLNSFNQTSFDSIDIVRDLIKEDLSACAEGNVLVKLQNLSECKAISLINYDGISIDNNDLIINKYDYSPEILESATKNNSPVITECLVSNLLKSNCLVTNQPDWGSVLITYKGAKINRDILLKYIISFRNHNEFHEQCIERIFSDILFYCKPLELSIYGRYTRRGGLDINPWRSTHHLEIENLRLPRQ
ncbi:NADPH-dependent 7-cyano-7-deazaguanine reductase QueF [Arsenophonus nasoniae]|uniref:NADPH-dependent 7-cyano-7-deazaguanine reductase n=1 Tax=Arsenophonus nasoniae TaxID=638 RepID=A0ABY8NWJ9_9GAMM|nr:NADPH-dependent 7-cyano-7-deazaguanine reductase QueF [Arsenophonus nasoniae]WGM08762.1 NADPH-dependent 7-cyano-7-deazaguanine reductase QueF [Arsenophonus nasoniae]